MLVKAGQLRPKAQDVVHLAHQNAIKLLNIVLDVTLRLFHILQNAHVLLNYVNNIIDVFSMLRNESLFLLKNDFD